MEPGDDRAEALEKLGYRGLVIITLLTLHLLASVVLGRQPGRAAAIAARRTAKAVLDRAAQAVYFPRLGRTYGKVGSGARRSSRCSAARSSPARRGSGRAWWWAHSPRGSRWSW